VKLTDEDKAAVTQALTDYYKAFSSLDAQAVTPYFHEPSQLVGPAGVVRTPTRAAVTAVFQPVMVFRTSRVHSFCFPDGNSIDSTHARTRVIRVRQVVCIRAVVDKASCQQ
jgi:hypothetical protein